VLVALVASALWWYAHTAGDHGPAGAANAQPAGLQVQAATGGAIAGRWTPPASGGPPDSYQVRVVDAGGGPTVASTESWSPSVVVGGLEVGGDYQLEVTPSGAPASATATSAPVVILADKAPESPASLTITPLQGTNGLQVAWTPAGSGVAATGALVQLYDGPAYRGYLTCQAGCTAAVFRDLAYGDTYTVRVVPINGAGHGAAAASEPLVLRNPCPTATACVAVDATSERGPVRLRADGFLNSLYPVGDMVALTRGLKMQSWRGAPGYQAATGTLDWSSWDVATATGAQTTMLLSNLWQSETTNGAGARTPWSNWTAYGAWVTATVRGIEASGHTVSYWEIQNEPGAPDYYSPTDWAASTVADYLKQFQVAYVAIKAADPKARIVGPSLSHFADYPGEYAAHEPDLVTFLDFAAQNHLELAAITLHEIDDGLGTQPRDYNSLPETIEDHVAEARRLIAARPALGRPQVWVNEYGRPSDYAIPGWTLGDIAALESASVDRAGRSCWPEQTGIGASAYNDCASPTLDGLLATDGTTPRADYWVYATYARMTGEIVATTSSDATISVLASANDAAGQVVAMIGRHVGCLPAVNMSCSGPEAVTVPPVPVAMGVAVPWDAAAATVTIAQVPPTWGPLMAPFPIFHGSVPITQGRLSLSLPEVADGDVYLVTIARRPPA